MTARPLMPRIAIGSTGRALRAELARAAGLPFNYRDAGASLSGRTPTGYEPIAETAVVGAGIEQFSMLAEGIRAWKIQTASGLRVEPRGPASEGVDVALAKTLGPVAIVASCRVVWTVDEPRHSGFGYGTLPGHPEAGEEAFVAELDDDGAVTFRVFGFTSRGTLATAALSPVARVLQRRTLTDYLHAAKVIAAG
jgi:uncharacterized protein (UPF0548 family)